MSITTGLVVFAVALALVGIELTLYFVAAILLALGGYSTSVPAFTALFVWIMAVTGAIGVFSAIGAVVERLAGKKNLAWYVMVPAAVVVGVVVAGYYAVVLLGQGAAPF